MNFDPWTAQRYNSQEELESQYAMYMGDKMDEIESVLEHAPKLKAVFRLTAARSYENAVDLATSIGLDTVQPLNAGARKLVNVIYPRGSHYSTDEKIILAMAFQYARQQGRQITYKQEKNGQVLATICPKP
jgi:hypothetical protein